MSKEDIDPLIHQEIQRRQENYLKNRLVLVTGAASGIGRGIAIRFAVEGSCVALLDINKDEVTEVAEKLREYGNIAQAFTADIRESSQIEQSLTVIEQQFGGAVTILINSAGITRPQSLFEPGFEKKWYEVTATDLIGPVMLSRQVASRMKMTGIKGNIINITSVHSKVPVANGVYYSAAKGGMVEATKSLALELAPFGIRVNAIAPGAVRNTGMNKEVTAENDSQKAQELHIPLGRYGMPEEIADAAVFLATNPYITGHELVIDGGFSLNH